MGQEIMRHFQLAPHYRIYIEFTFYRIDVWNSNNLNIYLDNNLVHNQVLSNGGGQQLCGDIAFDDQIVKIQLESQHSSNFAVLSLKTDATININQGFWGISDLSLSIEQCPIGCQYCESGSVIDCKLWELQFWYNETNRYTYYDHPLYRRFFNATLILFNLFLPQHNKIMIRFRMFVWQAYNLQYNLLINDHIKLNGLFQGHQLYHTFFDVYFPAFLHTETYISVTIQLSGGTQFFIPIKDFQLFIFSNQQQIFLSFQINNYCQDYESGWMPVETCCAPVCGDIVIGDGNNLSFHEQLQCEEQCIKCIFGVCLTCQNGYELDSNNKCISICGDGLVIPYQEECDDQNIYQGDGCYNCKLECVENCLYCYFGICQECLIGYKLKNDQCVPICGDKIIILEYEECDDGNNVEHDGCSECQYSCPLFCTYCIMGICYECQINYYLQNQSCYNDDQQEFDDIDDGSFQSVLETYSISQNNYEQIQKPKLIVKYVNQTFSIQYVEISFSQDVIIKSNEKIFDLQILNVAESNQNIQIYNLSNLIFLISIEITEQMMDQPVLSITFLQDAYNEFDMQVEQKNYQLLLHSTKNLNPQQKQFAQFMYKVNSNIVYCLAGLSLISLFFGESSIFKAILDILQYLNYLKFINLAYPENLYIFFQFTEMITITPFLQFINFNENYFNNQVSQDGKFAEYEVQVNLFINLICQLLQFIGLILTYWTVKIILKIYYSKIIIEKYFLCIDYLNLINPQFVLQAGNFLFKIVNFRKLYNLFQFKQILLMNSWDLLFKVLLCYKSSNDYLQFLLAFIISCFYLKIIFIELINLIRLILFLSFIVFLQSNQVQQTILILLTNLTHLIVIYRNHKPKWIDLIVQASIVLHTGFSIFYFEDFSEYINYNLKIKLGFAQMGILSSSIAAYLIHIIFNYCKQVILWVKQRREIQQNIN